MYDTQGRADGFNAIFIWDLLIRGRRMATLILYGEISLCSFWLPGLFFFTRIAGFMAYVHVHHTI